MFLRAYPYSQALALPHRKDKQRKPAHVEWYYRYNSTLHLIIIIGVKNRWDIIHPRERFVALPLYDDSNLRDLTIQTGNVQKTSFPFSCPYKRCSQLLDSIDVCFDPPCPHGHQPLLASDSLDWLSRCQSYIKIFKLFPFLRKNFKKSWIFKKTSKEKALKLQSKT